MLYACQERQGWYRDFAAVVRMPELGFVGSARLEDSPQDVAAHMAQTLGFNVAARANCRTWEEALRLFIAQADDAGVLVMVSGVVLSNNKRPLDLEEFRGFALADRRAPLVFINGKDTKSGQMFTLAHELAHLWLGSSAVSDASAKPHGDYGREEVWCNAVAAELLVPLSDLRHQIQMHESLDQSLEWFLEQLVRKFKVSRLVILRRLLDAGALNQTAFEKAWKDEQKRLFKITQTRPGGGNFYHTTLSRVGRRFAGALVESTLEGQTLYRDAFRMLGIRNTETFNNIGREAGIMR